MRSKERRRVGVVFIEGRGHGVATAGSAVLVRSLARNHSVTAASL
jgi:hypothetical protein